jgi:hypothetical protein
VNTGIISDYDIRGRFGVVDADDGRLLVFNLDDVVPSLRDRVRVGTRVKFLEDPAGPAPRAVSLLPVSPGPLT